MKKIICLLLVMLMLVSVVACGDNKEQDEPKDITNNNIIAINFLISFIYVNSPFLFIDIIILLFYN